jgi:peptidoglycan/xylan/chitin deacetylase (PgdA/CDA1 family)
MNAMWSEAKARVNHRLATHINVGPFRLRNETPMVSFTFDDIPNSAATVGATMLEDRDARGTFYISGGLLGAASPDWIAADGKEVVTLHRNGHEIGCHTFTHTRACDLDENAMAEELRRNRRYLLSLDPSIKIRNFAYPYGYGSFARKGQLKAAFQSCRSIVPGVNSATVDLQFLRAFPLIDLHIGCDEIDRAFDEAQSSNGWLIFYTHDVVAKPSPYGCTPALLDHALKAASRRKIPILSMSEALSCAGV